MSRTAVAFGRYSMSGGRFDEAEGLPLAVLGELKNYRDLVVDVAKRLYKREHPSKKKLPSGFERQIDLRITGIKHGCVVVEMQQVRDSVPLQPDLWGDETSGYDCVEEARALINKTIEGIKIKKDPDFIGDFPPESLPCLYRVGKYLEDDEKITLAESNNTCRVDVDLEWRSLVSNSSESQFVEKNVDGKLTGLVSYDDTFKYDFLIYDTRKTITARVEGSRWDEFFQFFNNRARARMCSLSIVCKVDDDGEIESVEQTYGIEESLPPRFANRLEELSHLEKGWYDSVGGIAQGEPIVESVFKYVQSFLRIVLTNAEKQDGLIDLVIFPQVEGGIQIEWKTLDYEVDFESDGSIVAYVFDDSREEDEKNFTDHSDPEDVLNWLIGGGLND